MKTSSTRIRHKAPAVLLPVKVPESRRGMIRGNGWYRKTATHKTGSAPRASNLCTHRRKTRRRIMHGYPAGQRIPHCANAGICHDKGTPMHHVQRLHAGEGPEPAALRARHMSVEEAMASSGENGVGQLPDGWERNQSPNSGHGRRRPVLAHGPALHGTAHHLRMSLGSMRPKQGRKCRQGPCDLPAGCGRSWPQVRTHTYAEECLSTCMQMSSTFMTH